MQKVHAPTYYLGTGRNRNFDRGMAASGDEGGWRTLLEVQLYLNKGFVPIERCWQCQHTPVVPVMQVDADSRLKSQRDSCMTFSFFFSYYDILSLHGRIVLNYSGD